MFQVAVLREMLEELFKDLEFAPAREAFIDGVPAAVPARQEPPLRAAAINPEDSFEEAAHIAPSAESDLGKGLQDGQNLLPLLVGQLNCRHVEQFTCATSTEPRSLETSAPAPLRNR